MKTPEVFKGTLAIATTITPTAPASSVAFENTMTTGSDSFGIKVNDSVDTWDLAPGDKLGLRIKNEITKIELIPISGSPTYQVFVH